MLSPDKRKKVEFICSRIASGAPVDLSDMIWIQKLSGASSGVREKLRRAQRAAFRARHDSLDSMDEFCDSMGLGDPDPSNHLTGESSIDDLVNWMKRDLTDDWRQRD